MSTSSNSAKAGPIENAKDVIERFGGIRPMAKKIDVAVTTVQGWKKRDVIPAARRKVIIEAAIEHNIDLDGVMADAPAVTVSQSANENEPKAEETLEAINLVERAEPEISKEDVQSTKTRTPIVEGLETAEGLEARLAEVEKQAVTKNTWITLALIVLVLAVVAAIIWPRLQGDAVEADRLAALEERTQELAQDVEDVQEDQSFFGTLIPENLDEQLSSLQQQAQDAKAQLDVALDEVQEKAQVISEDVLSENAGTIEERAVKLQGHLQDIAGSAALASMLERVQNLRGQEQGEAQLDTAVNELDTIVGAFGGQISEGSSAAFESTLDAARSQNDALAQTFAGVPATELKAAALLLTMSQFRSSLNRDNDAFASDLDVLKSLIGEDNVELRSAIDALAPQAESGVLTPSGLTNEFKTLAGDAVVSSLKGEDVSLGERASARFNEVLQVERDGELLTGTETQATINRAENLLEDGDIAAAVNAVEALDGPAADILSPWLKDARMTLIAEQVKALLSQSINTQAYGAVGQAQDAVEGVSNAVGGVLPSGSQLIQNEETGINILRGGRTAPLSGN